MKHTEKIKITPSLPKHLDNNDYVCNLRMSNNKSSLTPAGIPKTIVNGQYKPIVTFRHNNDKETLFVCSGDLLYYVEIDQDDNTPQYLCNLPNTPLCAIANHTGIIIMTRQGAFRIDFDSENERWIILGLLPDFPAFSFKATSTADFSHTIEKRTLSTSYGTQSSKLTGDDLNKLSSDLITAYNNIMLMASNAGYFIQPILAKYKLVDKDNNILFASCPVVVGLPSGLQAINSLEIEMPDYSALDSHELKLTGFKLSIMTPEITLSAWNDIVTAMVIETTPMINPIADSMTASHRIENRETTGAAVKTYLPGVATDMSVNLHRFSDMVVDMLENWDNIADKQCRIPYPLTLQSFETVDLQLCDLPTTNKDNNLMPINPCDTLVAECAEVAGDMTVWADITTTRYKGYPVSTFAIDHENSTWRGYSQVICHNDYLVNDSHGNDFAPTAFSPLIIYPDGSAESITLTLSKDGVVKSIQLPLKSSPSGKFACYINPGLASIELSQEIDTYIIPAHTAHEQFYNGGIAIANINSPMNLTAFSQIAQGRIMAVTQAVRSTSAWDFARKHLYLFADSGIYALAVNAARTALSAHIIDQRHVLSPDGVSFTPDGVIAIASGDMVKVTGARAGTLETDTDFASVAYCSRFNELWIKRTDGQLLIRDLTDGGYYIRDIKPQHMTVLSDRLLISDNNGIHDASQEVIATATKIVWNKRIAIDGNSFPRLCKCHDLPVLRDAVWRIFSSFIDGELGIYGDYGTAKDNSNRYLLSKFIISGALNSPVGGKIIAPQCPYISISIEAVVDNDFVFDNVDLLFVKI